MKRALPAVLLTMLLLVAASSSAWAEPSVLDIVDDVSQTRYKDTLDNLLYTHLGDNRGASGPGAQHDPARDNIFSEFAAYGLDTYYHSYDCDQYGNCTHNVVASHTGAVHPERTYIVGAHYDSVNNPGADDNASGVAGILEAARVLSQYEFESTILFIAFDQEEIGLLGSKAYVEDHLADDIRAMISMDMIAYNPTGADRARIYGREPTSTEIKQDLSEAVTLYGNGLTPYDSGSIGRSDHDPFQLAGFPACLLIEYDVWSNPYYHRSQDSVDTLDYIDYAYATNMTRSVVGYLANAAVPVPEPATLALLAFGALALLRKRRSQNR